MKSIFDMDATNLKALKKFYQKAPREFERATAGVLNSLAFKTRKNDIGNITGSMIVRNAKFIERSILVEKTRSGKISSQQSVVGSVRRPGFTGWEEQQTGKRPERQNAPTTAARGGNTRSVVRPKYRLRAKNKFVRPSQFKARSESGSFQFMMRVLATRGGGLFLLPDNFGRLGRGLYHFEPTTRSARKKARKIGEVARGKITRIQKIGGIRQPKTFHWRDISISQLQNTTDITRIWSEQIRRIMSQKAAK
jgi:hypothetical protein